MNDQRQVASCPHGELAVGWALRSLEPAEEALVAAHLPDCQECREVVAQTEEVGAMLGLSVPESVPSAALEQRILSVAGPQGVPPPAVPLGATAPASVFARPRFGQLAAAAAVIVALAAVALGIRVAQLGSQLGEARGQATAAAEAVRIAADPATVRVPLLATKGNQAVGMVLASPGQVAVVSTRLPSNQVADQTYVLWGLVGQTPIALAAFDVWGEAPDLHAIPSATRVGMFTGYAISLEPGRRAPAVPTDIVATGKVPS
ncbi:MAG TPA: anti-sigma factor [Pseudonocardiaceae bacterium]|nr:anti-sigma factor [Pseudonocardiaceae bacterium]